MPTEIEIEQIFNSSVEKVLTRMINSNPSRWAELPWGEFTQLQKYYAMPTRIKGQVREECERVLRVKFGVDVDLRASGTDLYSALTSIS